MHVCGGVDIGRARVDREQQVGFRHRLVVDEGGGARPRQPRAHPPQLHFETQPVAGHHLPPEFRVVDAAQPDAGGGRRLDAVEQQHRSHLRERLDHQDARHQRRPRKMTLEEFFVDGNVFDRYEPVARLVFGHHVDQEGWIAIVDAIEQRRKVKRH
jgi:hypothetical protein